MGHRQDENQDSLMSKKLREKEIKERRWSIVSNIIKFKPWNYGTVSFGFNSVSDFTKLVGGKFQITTDWAGNRDEEVKAPSAKYGFKKLEADDLVLCEWRLKGAVHSVFHCPFLYPWFKFASLGRKSSEEMSHPKMLLKIQYRDIMC